MTYGTDLGVAPPTVGDDVNWPGPTYATEINACIQACIDRLEEKVTPAGIDINAALEFNGYLATELAGAQFTAQSNLAAATYPLTIFGKSSNGDVYINDGNGNQIRVTAGGILDVSAASGITGAGYGATGVEVAWYAAANAYRFKDGALTTDYADIEVETLRLASGTTGFFAEWDAGAGMVANKTWTLPAAYPASTSVWTVTSAGQVVLTRALSVDSLALATTLNVTGTSTVAALVASGLITASVGLTAAVDQHVAVSGTGLFKHDSRTMWLPASNGSGSTYSYILDGQVRLVSAGDTWSMPIPLEVGKRLTGIVWCFNAAGASSKALECKRLHVTDGTDAVVDSTTNSQSGIRNVTQTLSPAATLATNYIYRARFTAGNNLDILYGIALIYDQP